MKYFWFFLFILFPSENKSDCLPADKIQGQYIVRLKPVIEVESGIALRSLGAFDLAKSRFEKHLKGQGVLHKTLFHPVSLPALDPSGGQGLSPRHQAVKVPPTTFLVNTDSASEIERIKSLSDVETVEQDCKVHLFSVTNPDDTFFDEQWGLEKINASAAWEITPGSKEVVVSVSDTGIDYQHEDLRENMWVNTKEVPGNRIDDDNNGCVDDIYGCNLGDQTGDPMPAAGDWDLLHGTHVAGIIGAVGNNGKGITGIAQNVRLMAAKGFGNSSGSTSTLLQSIYYSVNNGARVINCSWGRQGAPLQAELDAFKYAADYGVVVVASAGNAGLHSSGFSPASIASVITVGATDRNDQLAPFSNWGKIEILAPGGKGFDVAGGYVDPIFSAYTRSTGMYGELIGTSMAAPFVTGVVALMLSVNPKLSPADVAQILKSSGDFVSVRSATGVDLIYPRLNAGAAVEAARDFVSTGGGYTQPTCNSAVSKCGATTLASQSDDSPGGCGLVDNSSRTGGGGPGAAHLMAFAMILLVFFRLKLDAVKRPLLDKQR